jgi:hypothetical protein
MVHCRAAHHIARPPAVQPLQLQLDTHVACCYMLQQLRTTTAKASPGVSRALLRTYSGVYLLIRLHICFSVSSCSKLRRSCCCLQA